MLIQIYSLHLILQVDKSHINFSLLNLQLSFDLKKNLQILLSCSFIITVRITHGAKMYFSMPRDHIG